jgi:hypothetical protein
MGSKLIELGDGILVEVTTPAEEIEAIAGGMEKISDASMDKIKPIILAACKPVSEAWRELSSVLHVEEAEISLGLGFEAEGNLFVTKAKGNANLEVKLTLKGSGNTGGQSLKST